MYKVLSFTVNEWLKIIVLYFIISKISFLIKIINLFIYLNNYLSSKIKRRTPIQKIYSSDHLENIMYN